MKSKTIIISNEKGKGRGILSILQDNDLLQCRLRLYNVDRLSKDCRIGVYHNGEVFSGNLLEKQGVYTSSLVGEFNMESDFYVAIINTTTKDVLLSGGTYAGCYFDDSVDLDKKILNQECAEDDSDFCADHFNQEQNKTQSFESDELENDSDKLGKHKNPQDDSGCVGDCAHCKYKEYFYSSGGNQQDSSRFETKKQPFLNDDGEEKNIEESAEKNAEITVKDKNSNFDKTEKEQQKTNTCFEENKQISFKDFEEEQNFGQNGVDSGVFEKINRQFEYIFENYPPNEEISELVPNSKFVKMDDVQEYSIGALFENGKMEYICYAIKCKYNQPAPEELGTNYRWLPLDAEDPLSEGYYLVFQDAKDLKIMSFI